MKKLWLVLALALASGGLAAFLAVGYLGQKPSEALAAAPFRGKLAVASRDLPLGAVLGAGDIKLIDWPEEALPAGFVASPAHAVGRGLLTPLRANEPLLSSKLAGEGAGGGLPVLIPEGMRAVSVKVDEVVGVAGFVVPGTRVDVLTTLTPRTAQGSATTRLVLQNVAVAATGQSIEHDLQGKPQPSAVITLLVTPEQAEVLTLASTEGRIQLALRNTLDGTRVPTPGARVASLAGGAEPAAAPAARPARPRRTAPPARTGPVLEIFRGSSRSVTTF